VSEKERSKIEQHCNECDTCFEVLVLAGKMVKSGDAFEQTQAELDPVPENITRQATKKVKGLRHNSSVNSAARSVAPQLSKLLNKCTDKLEELFQLRTPAIATVRGGKSIIAEDHIQIKKVFSDLTTQIEFEKTEHNQFLVRIIPINSDLLVKKIRVTLFRKEREVSSSLMGKEAVIFDKIPFGHYTLIFTRSGEKLGEYPFEIKGTHRKRKP